MYAGNSAGERLLRDNMSRQSIDEFNVCLECLEFAVAIVHPNDERT